MAAPQIRDKMVGIMCGRLTLVVEDHRAIAEALGAVWLDDPETNYRARYNVAPGDLHWILGLQQGRRVLRLGRWGLPRRDGAGIVVNVRAENLGARPRCVVVADGFFEWQGGRGERRASWFHEPGGALLPFAGAMAGPRAPDEPPTFAVITTAANAVVAPIHERMPAILRLDGLDAWLMGAPASATCGPWERPLERVPVSSRVNGTRHDDPACIAPVPESLELPFS